MVDIGKGKNEIKKQISSERENIYLKRPQHNQKQKERR